MLHVAFPAGAQNFVVIDTEQVNPSVNVPVNDVLQVFPPGKLDTGTFGSIRNLSVLGTLINDADVRVGFSSESTGLQVGSTGEALNRVPFANQPARLQAAMGEVNGVLRNQGARLITGSYTESLGTVTGIPVGTTFASPSFGGFTVNGLVENLTFTTVSGFGGSSWTDTGSWTNHGNLSIQGRVFNTGLFESVNAPTLVAIPATLPYAQTITLGEASFARGALFENDGSGVVELRQGTTLVNAAEFVNTAGATVRVRQGGVFETTGEYSSPSSIIAGRFNQHAGGTTEVDGGVLRTRDRGAIFNDGIILLSGNAVLDNGNYVLNRTGGTIELVSDSRITQGSGGLLQGLFENAGLLNVQGTMTGGTLTTTGRLIVATGGVLETNELSIAGGHVTIDGRVGPDPSTLPAALLSVFMTGGQLDGSGFINGDLFLSGSGPAFDGPCSAAPSGIACFTPGNSPGSMEIGGTFTLGSGSVLELEISLDALGNLAFDTVSARSMRFEAGSLIRVVLDPAVGTVAGPLDLLNCVDGFDCIALADADVSIVGGTASFQFGTAGFFVSEVTAVPEPSEVALMLTGLAVMALRLRRRWGPVAAVASRVG